MQRSIVRQPGLTLNVTDGSAPVSNSSVYLYWVSNPYSRLEEVRTFTTDGEGKVGLEQLLQSDTAYPFVLHGVSEYQHKLCIESEGYRSLLVTLAVLPGDEIRLGVSLTKGTGPSVCNSYETLSNHPNVSRPDVTAQHPSIQGAYEVTNE